MNTRTAPLGAWPNQRRLPVPCNQPTGRREHSLLQSGSVMQHAYSDRSACASRFNIKTSPHYGSAPGAAMECHDVFILGNFFVSVYSRGRSHTGWITFDFEDKMGQPCTAAAWASQHQAPWLATIVHSKETMDYPYYEKTAVHNSVYDGPGIRIELYTFGRMHSSSFFLSPTEPLCDTSRAVISMLLPAPWCGRCRAVDVLQEEGN